MHTAKAADTADEGHVLVNSGSSERESDSHIADIHIYIFRGLSDLHGPPKESKFLRRDSLKGLLPYIRAVSAVVAAAHDGYSRSGFLSA